MALRDQFPFAGLYRFLERIFVPILKTQFADPNQISWIGLGIAVTVPLGFWLHPWLGFSGLVLSGLADMMDGMLARHKQQESDYGAFLDSTMDRMADFFFLAGFWVLWWGRPAPLPAAALFLISILGTFLISYLKARAQSLGLSCDVGWMERGLRTLYLILWALLLFLLPQAVGMILWAGLIIYAALVWRTVLQRFGHVYRELKEIPAVPSLDSESD